MAIDPKYIQRHYYTLNEYFALEKAGDARYEYWDGEIVCMSGGSLEHNIISRNVMGNLFRLLSGSACQPFGPDMAIRTPALPPYRYPDVSVVCGKPIIEDIDGIAVMTNPILVVEVLSPGTVNHDRNEKRIAYQALPSLEEYLLIAQDAPQITHYLKENDRWSRRDYGDLSAILELRSLSCRLSFKDVYDGVEFN